MDVSPLFSLGAVQIGAAAALITEPITDLNGLAGLSGSIRFAGTGGTSVDVYLQETLDGGASWIDLANAHFTAAGVQAFSLVQGAADGLALTDGALAQNSLLNDGVVPLFDQYRLKIVSLGTWVNGLVSAWGMPRG